MEKKNLFDQYYEMSEEAAKAEEKDLVKNKLRRKFEAAYDDAKDKILSLKENQSKMFKDNFKNFDLNSFRQASNTIEAFEDAKKEISDLHKQFFGEDIRN
jgi:hypothetical protein